MFLEHSGAFLQRSYVSFLSTSSEEDEGTALNSQTLCFFIGGRVFTNGQNEPPSYKLFLMDRICDFSFQIRNCSYRNIQPHHIVHLNISYLKYWLYIALDLEKRLQQGLYVRWVYYKNQFNVWHLTTYICKCLWIKMKRSSI